MRFHHVASNVPVEALKTQIDQHPELWNQYEIRTRDPNSPFHGVPDIWVRYRQWAELTNFVKYLEPHPGTFYPAWDALPALHPIVFDLMHTVRATYLGAILITTIPPHGHVKPHHDRYSWHCEFTDCKAFLAISGKGPCIFHAEDETLSWEPGEAYAFNNMRTHSVQNLSDQPRTTAIICMRTASGNFCHDTGPYPFP